jgi:hypothetical protein
MKTLPRLCAILSTLILTSAPCAPAFAEEALGRLFFTPERRQTLDRQRQFNIQEKQEIPEEPTFTIDGVVTRSSGKQTVWLNGVAHNDDETPGGVVVFATRQQPGSAALKTTSSPDGNARVGDTINRATGESTDTLNGGRIVVKQRPAR